MIEDIGHYGFNYAKELGRSIHPEKKIYMHAGYYYCCHAMQCDTGGTSTPQEVSFIFKFFRSDSIALLEEISQLKHVNEIIPFFRMKKLEGMDD
jgi:hypothetical protein